MRSIKNITLGLATVGVMSLSGCAGDYLDTIPSTCFRNDNKHLVGQSLYSIERNS